MTSDVDRALDALARTPERIDRSTFRRRQASLRYPGLYAWWADDTAIQQLSQELDTQLPSLIYAGQAGATKWPSGTRSHATLATRVGGQHFAGNTYSSTFRRTLASALRTTLSLRADPAKAGRLDAASNRLLTEWIAEHLVVSLWITANRDALGQIEQEVLEQLDPPLNIEGRPTTPLRQDLGSRRKWLAK